jgi:hypothetical protein
MANSTSAAENALRKLLINMRNEAKTNHTQALVNFKAAVRAYNKTQSEAVQAANAALANPELPHIKKALGLLSTLTRRNALMNEAAKPPQVKIGKNNFTINKNNKGKIVGIKGRGGTYHIYETQNGKNYVQLENGAWYQAGNTTGRKYNKNKSSGKFTPRQGFLGRIGGAVGGAARGVGGAVAGGARATGGAVGGLFRRRGAKPVKPNSETASLLRSTN